MKILLCLVACLAVATPDQLDDVDPHTNPLYYTNTWAVKIQGGPEVAKRVAEARGFDYIEPIPSIDDHYFLVKSDHPATSDYPATHHTRSLLSHDDVDVAYQQNVLQRSKRDLQISTRQTSTSTKGCFSWMTSPYVKMFNDPMFNLEWYILDYRKDSSETRLDLNVIPCWLNNITGRGSNVVFVDDGVDFRNEDLYANYNPRISVDLVGKDNDPTPVYSSTSGDENSHGTRCAGEVAMVANNGKCGVGIAYNSNFGGIRLLDAAATDALEAQALKYACENVDISSNSWGPSDNGKLVEAMGPLTQQAIEYCIVKGRNGKGTIYIFACGNGKMYGDSCAADGFAQSIYTMAIASSSQTGQCPFYSEECAAVIATAYSSGTSKQEMVLTTDLRNGCCAKHAGTSAAAPMASGIYALALEANPKISWRDAQYLAVFTCEVAPLANNDGWKKNGANFWVSNKFGFGLFSAFDLVKLAKNWVNVPPKNVCELSLNVGKINLPVGKMTSIPFTTDGCADTEDEVSYLEHVEVITTIASNFRGSINAYIKSPSGTTSLVFPSRAGDSSTAGLKSWKVMSVQQWGENPKGQWTVQIYIEDIANAKVSAAQLTELTVKFHGPSQTPNCYKQGDRKYAKFTLPSKRKRRSIDMVEEIILDEVKTF